MNRRSFVSTAVAATVGLFLTKKSQALPKTAILQPLSGGPLRGHNPHVIDDELGYPMGYKTNIKIDPEGNMTAASDSKPNLVIHPYVLEVKRREGRGSTYVDFWEVRRSPEAMWEAPMTYDQVLRSHLLWEDTHTWTQSSGRLFKIHRNRYADHLGLVTYAQLCAEIEEGQCLRRAVEIPLRQVFTLEEMTAEKRRLYDLAYKTTDSRINREIRSLLP